MNQKLLIYTYIYAGHNVHWKNYEVILNTNYAEKSIQIVTKIMSQLYKNICDKNNYEQI